MDYLFEKIARLTKPDGETVGNVKTETIEMSKGDIMEWIDVNCGNIHIYDLPGTALLIHILLDRIKANGIQIDTP
jgi:hypothetical protein